MCDLAVAPRNRKRCSCDHRLCTHQRAHSQGVTRSAKSFFGEVIPLAAGSSGLAYCGPTVRSGRRTMNDILEVAREQVLEQGVGLTQEQLVEVLRSPDEQLDDLLALAHEVRVKWCGEEVEVEG